jgi:hypothetical protein
MNTTTIDKYGGTTAFIAQPRCEECLEAECYYASDPSRSPFFVAFDTKAEMDSWLKVNPDVVRVGFGKKPSDPCFRSPSTEETTAMTRDDFKLLADALREVEPKTAKANSAEEIQWINTCFAIVAAFEKANPRFNASWFLTAAGFYK